MIRLSGVYLLVDGGFCSHFLAGQLRLVEQSGVTSYINFCLSNQWFKKERRDENISRGKDFIDKEIKTIDRVSLKLLEERLEVEEEAVTENLNFLVKEFRIPRNSAAIKSLEESVEKIKDLLVKVFHHLNWKPERN